jgi:CBS domain-containing protein
MSNFCKTYIVSVLSSSTLQEAAETMRDRCVGSVVVIDHNNQPIGVLTDRDIVVKAVANGSKLNEDKVRQYMSQKPIVFPQDGDLLDAIRKMRDHSVRRLLITNGDGQVCGLLSTDDLVQLVAEEAEALSELFSAQNGTVQRHRSHDYTQMI